MFTLEQRVDFYELAQPLEETEQSKQFQAGSEPQVAALHVLGSDGERQEQECCSVRKVGEIDGFECRKWIDHGWMIRPETGECRLAQTLLD